MLYRKLGRTNLNVSVIGIGGGAFKNTEVSTIQIKNVISQAIENGVNFIETAEDYGEEKISLAIRDCKEKIILASKSFSSSEKEMKKSIENSLKKLQVKKIDIYMMHTVESLESLNFRIKNGVLAALKKEKKEGKIDWIGITTHSIRVGIEAIRTNEFDVIEIPYCIGSYETEKIFKHAKKYKVGIISMRPFGGGILIDRSKKMEFMNIKNALGYALSNKNVACALVGTKNEIHMKEIIEAVNSLNFSKINRKGILKNVEKILGKDFCRGCLACMPCKKYGWWFPIDQLMRIWTFYFKYKIKSSLEEYKKIRNQVGKCSYCKECEKKCPYKVPITRNLKMLERQAG